MNNNEAMIRLALGSSRKSQAWTTTMMPWDDFADRCERVKRTWETAEQYAAMDRDRQGDIKDVGGFVGAMLKGPRRQKSNVMSRTMATLDLDYADDPDKVWEGFTRTFPNVAALMYSTHKHTADKPRLRIVVPFRSPIAPEAYELAARVLAQAGGFIDQLDGTTYDIERLFYWPSASKDAPYVFRRQDGDLLDAHSLLKGRNAANRCEYPKGAHDSAEAAPQGQRGGAGGLLADPEAKPGVVGAFCRAHSPIEDALADLLPDIYAPAGPHRYTYAYGTTKGGAVAHEGKFLMSRHDSDPARGEHNIWDLVRIHRYGHLDTPDDDRASFRAMMDYAKADAATKAQMAADRVADLETAFGEIPPEEPGDAEPQSGTEDPAPDKPKRGRPKKAGKPEPSPLEGWMAKLDTSVKKGGEIEIKPTARNVKTILENDPDFAGKIAYDLMAEAPVVAGEMPWPRHGGTALDDTDLAQMRIIIEGRYGIAAERKVLDAIAAVASERAFHPVRDYLEPLEWDGKPRLDTVFVDYLGAEDTPLVRAFTRKQMVAAVRRVMEPGCKHDYTLVLSGAEGCGKSSALRILAGEWFSDSVSITEGKESSELLRNVWLAEFSELTGLRRSDEAAVKNFLSRQHDDYRRAYDRLTSSHPRQCVFFGTTNEEAFLRSDGGNRRFWPVRVDPARRKAGGDWRKTLEAERDQIWAEAVDAYRKGEPTHLGGDMEEQARVEQARMHEDADDPIRGALAAFLDEPLPLGWDAWPLSRRRAYWRDPAGERAASFTTATERRESFSVCEFVCEYMGIDLKDREYRRNALKVAKYVREIGGWTPVAATRRCSSIYGIQRGFFRAAEDAEMDDI